MLQLAAGARPVPQLFVDIVKSPLFTPAMAINDIVRGAEPVFVTWMAWGALAVLISWFPKLRLPGLMVTVALPAPLRGTHCGLPVALSVMQSVALRAPTAVGVNVTWMLQLAAGARPVPQLFVEIVKSPLFTPAMAIVDMVRGATELAFVTEMGRHAVAVFTDWLPQLRLVGLIMGAPGRAPPPLRGTHCGLPVALSVMQSVALRAPTAAGVNVTWMLQLVPGARPVPQLFVEIVNSPLFTPVIAIADMVRGAEPVFVTWMGGGHALAVLTVWLPQLRLGGLMLTVGDCNRMVTELLPRFATARSSLPSRLKSPLVIPVGAMPVG